MKTLLPKIRFTSKKILIPITVLILVSMACSLPWTQKTPVSRGDTEPSATAILLPTPQPTATSKPRKPLPPAVIETFPLAGSEVSLDGMLTLVFNQPMDKSSVEAAFLVEPTLGGKITWSDELTLTFKPDKPFQPNTEINLSVNTKARAANGLSLAEVTSWRYRTAPTLLMTQMLPADGGTDIDTGSAIVAAFNVPVVALGEDEANLPAPFNIDPAVDGRGEWLNTSTYIFYPEPPLSGGASYTITLDPALTSNAGATLDENSPSSWTFSTTMPRVDLIQIEGDLLGLDSPISIKFNVAMDPASVEANFNFQDPEGQLVGGEFTWNDRKTEVKFKPAILLTRNTTYNLTIAGATQAAGGTAIGYDTSSSFTTYPEFSLFNTIPSEGGTLDMYGGSYGSFSLSFSAPIKNQSSLKDLITISPAMDNLYPYLDQNNTQVNFSGYVKPETAYTVTVSGDLEDAWGQTLGKTTTFSFFTPKTAPSLTMLSPYDMGAAYLTPDDAAIPVQASNLTHINMLMGAITFEDVFILLGPNGWDARQNYLPANPIYWTIPISVAANSNQIIDIPIQPNGQGLAPGVYYIEFSSDEITDQYATRSFPVVLVVSPLQVTMKLTQTEAFAWVVNATTLDPVTGTTVSFYGEDGALIGSGETGSDGTVKVSIVSQGDPYQLVYAATGTPGSKDFGFTISMWNQGMNAWDFGIETQYNELDQMAYVYTDRPIYRPGQVVYYKAVIRHPDNGRYSLPDTQKINVKILGDPGMSGERPVLQEISLGLNAFGTAHGELQLSENANPGYYQIEVSAEKQILSYLDFQVANYRKPEINLQVDLQPQEFLAGSEVTGEINASYFFGAPAGGLTVNWTLYSRSDYFNLPRYEVGPLNTGWLLPIWFRGDYWGWDLGTIVESGTGTTGPDGKLQVSVSADALARVENQAGMRRLTLEVTSQDESGLPVSQRTVTRMHPAKYYIGVRPQAWFAEAGDEFGFDILTVDWDAKASSNHALEASFYKVDWVPEASSDPYMPTTYTQQTTLIGSASPTTDGEGKARLTFSPPDPGTYRLDVSGDGSLTQVLVWVGGAGTAAWPTLPDQQIRLTADADRYEPGQTPQIFIPNPFQGKATALVTIERSRIMRHQVISVEGSGYLLEVPISQEDAPNVYLSITLIGIMGGQPDFRQGYINLEVDAASQLLNVQVTINPPQAHPGEQVLVSLSATDPEGHPVQGEFSISMVDLALLALADPNAPGIISAFYDIQPVGVRTSLSLGGYAARAAVKAGGLGGGGDGDMQAAPSVARENFQDLAYWNAEIVTGPDGKAQISVTLPDNLTTWKTDVRGLTEDTLVGQAEADLVTTKDLLVRPQTPRFMVVGDHLELAAVVHNNTGDDLTVDVTLASTGFTLDDPSQAVQSVTIGAGQRVKVGWWGVVDDLTEADLVFSAVSGDLQDASRPTVGKLPIRRYITPQTFSTAGVLSEEGSRLELVSLPRSFTPQGGELRLELNPSLASAILESIEVVSLEPYDDAVTVLSRFLPAMELINAYDMLGLDSSSLRLQTDEIANESINRLANRQNYDGGWSWWYGNPDKTSDEYITAYVLYGLGRAKIAGYYVNPNITDRAQQFLLGLWNGIEADADTWWLDRQVFIAYALQSSGINVDYLNDLYQYRARMSPWARALIALTQSRLGGAEDMVRTLVSDLESSAIRSATGAHWESEGGWYINADSPVVTTAFVIYSLAQLDPKSPLLPDAVRYVMAHRNSDRWWGSAFDSSWVLSSMAEYMKVSGDAQPSFTFDATLNDDPFAEGQAGSGSTVITSVPVEALYSDGPNALLINRQGGSGQLYYRADLQVSRPVETAPAIAKGINLARAYYLAGQDCSQVECLPVEEITLSGSTQQQIITVRLTMTLPHDTYNLILEDTIPAGTEIYNPNLKTSQQGVEAQPDGAPVYDPYNPFKSGWGWWWFNDPQIFDDHITWSVNFLPSGTYELTYRLVPYLAGEFRVIPARAWQFFFPEVQGSSTGSLFMIKP